MNYVGQLAGQVFVTVKELYKGLNPATLSGCIDIIVIRQPNGNLQCSPFHVRFGKMGVLRSREKVVDIEINGESVDLHMKLGDNGEAFFVQETDNDQEVIPMHLATSPILSEGASRMECQLKRGSVDRIRGLDAGTPAQVIAPSETPSSSSVVKKRRKRRRKSQLDSLKRDDSVNTSEDEDMFPIEMSSDEAMELLESSRTLPNDMSPFQDDIPKENLSPTVIYPQSASYPNSDREWSPTPSPSGSRPSTPKSDSELVSKSTDRTGQKNLEMLWLWGELPQAAKSSSPHKMKESSPLSTRKICDKSHFQAIHSESSDTFSDQSPTLVGGALLDQNKPQTEMQFVNEEDLETLGAAAPLLPMIEELKPPSASVVQTANKTDSPSRKKDKRSRHLGADGVYLDDLTDMDPEVAALYFPKNGDPSGLAKHASDNGARSANQSPQSVGSSGVDSGVESTSDGLRDLPSIAISLCGGLSDHREITKDAFLEQAVSYQQFVDNPAIIDDPNLVVKIGIAFSLTCGKKYPKHIVVWCPSCTVGFGLLACPTVRPAGTAAAGPSLAAGESKPEQCLAGNGHSTGEQPPQLSMATRVKHESSSSDEERAAAKPSNSGHLPLLPNVSYKKTLRLTSEQLKSLKLKNGPNDVVFSVTTQYQGTCRCEGTIYLWNWDDKVIISDIDGTITRSDTLGHILPTLGKDWTHQGIAKLYHKVSQNGYKFLYCSARAIGMADMTRGYLHWVNERGTVLPQGPLLLSPSSLFSALHRDYTSSGLVCADLEKSLWQAGYVRLCEVVDHVFPLLKRSHSSDFPCSDTFSNFTFWREPLPPFENQDIHSASA
ncbi:hypothetical protein EGK_05063 [Macaca mulatta]|uniref:phosphatidate phosphatase n=1 Tax=Macaca mulatta TaxID=9544 RepID=G7NBB0_MACMU|nr:hypothetical protein EGK_05063 [Macaca mulatta]